MVHWPLGRCKVGHVAAASWYNSSLLQLASNLKSFWQLGALHQGAFPVVDCCSMLAGQIIQFGVVQHVVS